MSPIRSGCGGGWQCWPKRRLGGDREAFVAALKEFDLRLHLYPPFGDPLTDLMPEQGRLWNGIIRPLAMRYAIYEDRRLVTVTALPILLPRTPGEQHDPAD